MMPNIVKALPREYSGGQSPTRVEREVHDGVPEVEELWADYTGDILRSESWVIRKRILAVARKYMRGFFLHQDHNEAIQDYNYDFLLDTLRFVVEGERRLSVWTWLELVTHENPEPKDVSERFGIRNYLKEHGLLSMSYDELIQRWCSHPNGIDDMMVSLNIIFGRVTRRVP